MKAQIVNETAVKSSWSFIQWWTRWSWKQLKKKRPDLIRPFIDSKKLVVAITNEKRMRELNGQFRKKNYATDILSFEAVEKGELGQLILCWPVVKKQAKEHGLTLEEEAGYLVLHGILHLLGLDHERSKKEEKIMMTLQDEIFEDLCQKMKPAKK